jgi:hypothetical protein
MSNPIDPTVPNYKKNVGRLATDRYDFEEHINGLDFRHNADAINVIPNLVVGLTTSSNVLTALEALRDATLAPTINDATTLSKGIIQLAGDIGGVATSIIVTHIQNKPISTLPPSSGDVLTWDGAVWKPATAVNIFNAGGDLSGDNVLQEVIGFTGVQHSPANWHTINSAGSVIDFVVNANPLITQETVLDDDGSVFTIRAQSSSDTNKNGAPLILAGGAPGSGGRQGGVRLQFTSNVPVGYPTTSLSGITSSNMVQLSEVAVGRRVLSLCHAANLSTVDMPSSTGDMVIYIRNAVTNPSSGNPSNGAILYSRNGQLWVKQQDGNNFQVGTIQNPSIQGPTGEQVYTSRNSAISIGGSGILIFSFNLPDNTCTAVDVTLVGKRNASTDSSQFNFKIAYSRHGGSPVALGVVTTTSRTSGGASGWNIPSVGVSGNTLQVFTGSQSGSSIRWVAFTQLITSLNDI